jgi:hypothetical protein
MHVVKDAMNTLLIFMRLYPQIVRKPDTILASKISIAYEVLNDYRQLFHRAFIVS